MSIAWGSTPSRAGSYVPIFRPRPGATDFVLLLGPYLGVDQHWLGDRSMPCRGDKCHHCAAENPKRWRGYFPAFKIIEGRTGPVVFEITEAAANRFDDRECAGLLIEVSRRERAALVVRFPQQDEMPSTWQAILADKPQPFDVRAVLLRIWGIKEDAVSNDENGPATIAFRRHA
jgi:hypothetical protein